MQYYTVAYIYKANIAQDKDGQGTSKTIQCNIAQCIAKQFSTNTSARHWQTSLGGSARPCCRDSTWNIMKRRAAETQVDGPFRKPRWLRFACRVFLLLVLASEFHRATCINWLWIDPKHLLLRTCCHIWTRFSIGFPFLWMPERLWGQTCKQ